MRYTLLVLALFALSSPLEAGFISDLFDAISGKKESSTTIEIEPEPQSQPREDSYPEKTFYEDESGDIFSNSDLQTQEEPIDEGLIAQKEIFLQYLSYPKRVYVNEHFYIDIKAIITKPDLKSIATSFVGGKRYKILNPNATWQKIENKIYQNRYYFKLLDKSASLPHLTITATNQNQDRSQETIEAKPINIIELKSDEYFCNVIASKFEILSHHEKRYDEKQNIVLLEINASMSNLEDMHLGYANREALDKFEDRLDSQSIYYVAIIPNYLKEFKFKYFNQTQNQFVRVKFPIIIADQSISTQTNLNPKKSKYYTYKIAILFAIALVLFLIFLRYRSILALLLALGLLIWTVYTKVLTQSVVLKEGTKIRILPVENSTIFYKNAQVVKVKVLHKKRGYLKVILPNQKIGWVKEDDIAKN